MLAKLLSTDDAAKYVSLSKSTLEHYRIVRKGPPFLRVGPRCIRYRVEDLEAWLNEQVVETSN